MDPSARLKLHAATLGLGRDLMGTILEDALERKAAAMGTFFPVAVRKKQELPGERQGLGDWPAGREAGAAEIEADGIRCEIGDVVEFGARGAAGEQTGANAPGAQQAPEHAQAERGADE